MKLLAIETSTEACSVALAVEGDIYERLQHGQQHSSLILPMVEEVLAQGGLGVAQVEALAFGCGPGMFTGLRIGAGVVQGIAYAADLPVIPVSSLAALAQGCEVDHVLVAMDARMEQLYWGIYMRDSQGVVAAQGEEVLAFPQHVPLPETGLWVGAGTGWDRYADLLAARIGVRLQSWKKGVVPRASSVASLALARGLSAALAAEQVGPVYLRDKVAKKISER